VVNNSTLLTAAVGKNYIRKDKKASNEKPASD